MACKNNTTVAPPINTIFIKMGESPPICREHIHTGRPHTQIIDKKAAFSKNLECFFQ